MSDTAEAVERDRLKARIFNLEQVLAHAHECINHWGSQAVEGVDDETTLSDDLAAIEAAISSEHLPWKNKRSRKLVEAPLGWILVPIIPTQEMLSAGATWSVLPEATWADMVDAVLEPPVERHTPIWEFTEDCLRNYAEILRSGQIDGAGHYYPEQIDEVADILASKSGPVAPAVTTGMKERLANAIEGECDGLAIDDAQAGAILAHTLIAALSTESQSADSMIAARKGGAA